MPRTAPPVFRELAIAIALDGRPRYEIAAAAKMAPNMLSGIVCGRITPAARHQQAIAKALQSTPAALFGAPAAA